MEEPTTIVARSVERVQAALTKPDSKEDDAASYRHMNSEDRHRLLQEGMTTRGFAKQQDVAKKVGISSSYLSEWKKHGKHADRVVPRLVAHGFLPQDVEGKSCNKGCTPSTPPLKTRPTHRDSPPKSLMRTRNYTTVTAEAAVKRAGEQYDQEMPIRWLYESIEISIPEAAKIRRDAIVRRMSGDRGLPSVGCTQVRVLCMPPAKDGTLQYEELGVPGTIHKVGAVEAAQLMSTSRHFRKVIEYLGARGSRHLQCLGQEDPNVVYLAVMCRADGVPEDTLLVNHGDTTYRYHGTHDQAYVGKAKNGILGRWGRDGNHHVKMANHLHLKGHQDGPTPVDGAMTRSRDDCSTMLVDATMRLHCSRGGMVWIFVVAQVEGNSAKFADPLSAEETRLIKYFGTLGEHGMNMKS